MGQNFRKVKSVAKLTVPKSERLSAKILETLKLVADIVGSTLGPGGCPVLIERQEYGFPNLITKDGVTVFRSLGFQDPIAHALMESARDAAVRTANEAGDGPQPLWSKVLTPTGFVEMRDVRVGMDVCGTNGTIQKVTGVYSKGSREIVKVTFGDGAVVECCEDHLWSVTTNYGLTKTLPVRVLAKDFKTVQLDGSSKHKYYTPRTTTEFSSSQSRPLDPYLVGVLLGDGSLCDSGSIELSLGDAKEHIINKLVLPNGLYAKVSYVKERNSFRVKINGQTAEGWSARDFIDTIGLRNTNSHTKYIPQAYLLSTVADRRRLLQGLIDTDGHINSQELFEFSTVSEQLASDFHFLTRSLGKSICRTLHTRKEGDGGYSRNPIWRFTELKGDRFGNKIVDIQPTGQFTEMQCISVSNSDNLYVTDDFAVTHNTTTATVLAEGIVRYTSEYCKANPKVSPQRVVRLLERIFNADLEPEVKRLAITPDEQMLHAVAKCSANGDQELADAIMKCFDLAGDDGNITIIERSGPSKYEVDVLKGYPVGMGYEDSLGRFHPAFINDRQNARVYLEKPLFILNFGSITEIQQLLTIISPLGEALDKWNVLKNDKDNVVPLPPEPARNIVVVATSFSESVLGQLAHNFSHPDSINILPLKVPMLPMQSGQMDLLQDLAAVTGSKLFDPIRNPIIRGKVEELGYQLEYFEMGRYRSNVVGIGDESYLLARVEEVRATVDGGGYESELELSILKERLGKLTGGIAKLTVVGASNGEIREKKDRAEDAACAVRGALKYGCLPGGCWTLAKLQDFLYQKYVPLPDSGSASFEENVIQEVLCPALEEPFKKLLTNCGYNDTEIHEIESELGRETKDDQPVIYDALNAQWTDAKTSGVMDSTPAVLEALRNSISIAALLGTLGGAVVFPRDTELERSEASDTYDFLNSAGAD